MRQEMKDPVVMPAANGTRSAPRTLALVFWNGTVGGAEVVMVGLATAFCRAGVEAEVVFVTDPGPLGHRLTASGVPFRALGFRRGRDILRHPRRYAAEVARVGPDGVLLPECGYVGMSLRAGGYRGPIVAIEHGSLLIPERSSSKRTLRRLCRLGAAWSDDAEVAVSDFMLARMREHPHSRRIYRIHNGIDPPGAAAFLRTSGPDGLVVVGFAGRLIPGKGADQLISAFAALRKCVPAKLRLAGDGPDGPYLARLVQTLGLGGDVEFLGMVHNIYQFWSECDIAVFPTQSLPESFGLAALEAMSCGRPVVSTSVGALPELVVDGETGTLVQPGDVEALAATLTTYAQDPSLRRRHGAAGQQRALARFTLDQCARQYLDLFDDLTRSRLEASGSQPAASQTADRERSRPINAAEQRCPNKPGQRSPAPRPASGSNHP